MSKPDDLKSQSSRSGLEVAVIGMAGRFPGGSTIESFWANLCDGVESVSSLSEEDLRQSGVLEGLLDDANYVRARAILDDIDLFDADFFGITPKEARLLDPQQRLVLECAWEALEHAGYDPERYPLPIGVYAGSSTSGYIFQIFPRGVAMQSAADMAALLGVEKDSLPTRISYKLNLEGPSLAVQTACSTSLVAVHLACQGLVSGECDMALAGGASISIPQKVGYLYQDGGIASPDGHCRAFDIQARGTVGGSGVGMVLLKRLEDAIAEGDHILAVIRGSAINNDGASKIGYTAPRIDGQAKVIQAAHLAANIEADSITYVEAHGTGTSLGDPIEITALTKAFRLSTARRGYCALGSVKTNIGHLDAAAGIAGFIKAVLALYYEQIPPSLHFTEANTEIDFPTTPFYVNTQLQEWRSNGQPRRAGVSSFGLGGTNAHLVLEEAPTLPPPPDSRPWYLLPLSARTPEARDRMLARLLTYVKQHEHLRMSDVAHTLQLGRRHFEHRAIAVCRDRREACRILDSRDPTRLFTDRANLEQRPFITFLFPGQGAQHVQMAADLYRQEPVFREEVDRCVSVLKPHIACDLTAILYPPEENHVQASAQLQQTAMTQSALFVIEYALAKLWMHWGVHPQAMLGHSIGEYVAACLAGVFSLKDAMFLVAVRGQLLQRLPQGSMLAVATAESQIRSAMSPDCDLAAVNGEATCVVSGTTQAIEALERWFENDGIATRRLHVSHAFHSRMVEPILPEFFETCKKVSFKTPHMPFISNVTGTWITNDDAVDPHYWVRHMRQTVRFADGVRVLLSELPTVILEVGPGETLSLLARREHSLGEWSRESCTDSSIGSHVFASSLPHPRKCDDSALHLWKTVGRLWLAGVPVDWSRLYDHTPCRRVPLPTYPFERQRYWFDAQQDRTWMRAMRGNDEESEETVPSSDASRQKTPETQVHRSTLAMSSADSNDEMEQRILAIWHELFGIARIGPHDSFFELGGESLLAVQLLSHVRTAFNVELSLADFFKTPTVSGLSQYIRAAQGESARAVMPPLRPRASLTQIPLSFAQERLWFVDQLEEGSPFYHLSMALRIRGQLASGLVEDIFNRIVSRHESLRTTFLVADGQPRQDIRLESHLVLSVTDLRTCSGPEQNTRIHRMIQEEAQRPFNLQQAPPIRIHLLRCTGEEQVFVITLHHIIADGWSFGIFMREFAAYYDEAVNQEPSHLPALTVQYADYACWQREWLSGDALAGLLSYWKTQLHGIPATLDLPTDFPRPAVQTYQGKTYSFTVAPGLTHNLRKLSRGQHMTLFTTLLGAFQVLMSRYSGQNDFCVGTPVANRHRSEVEPLIGFFANTLVLRADVSGDPTFLELAARVHKVVRDAQSHAELPFEKLVDELQPVRNLSANPLFQVMFSLQPARLDLVNVPGLEWTQFDIDTHHARFDITFDMMESEDEIRGHIEYRTDLFDRQTIMRMAEQYQTLLNNIVTKPEAPLSRLSVLPPSEEQRIVLEWNATPPARPERVCLHQLFEVQASESPDRLAIQYDRESLTYRELNTRADQLSRTLQQVGVGPDQTVALCVDRSLDMVVGLLAILKAGGAYVPIDPSYPEERIAFMLTDAQVTVLLSQERLQTACSAFHGAVVHVDSGAVVRTDESVGCVHDRVMPENLAYMIYTSGSTGRPKGVMVSHRNACQFLAAMEQQLLLSPDDVLLAETSLSFDIALLELFLPLMVGAKVVLADKEAMQDGFRLRDLLESSNATVMQGTPATWRMLQSAGWTGSPTLTVLCGGESLPFDLAEWLEARNAKLWNLYGPTETTVWSTSHRVEPVNSPISIGRAIANAVIYLLSPSLDVVPIGVPGEIYIGGEGVARGYWHRPELTAERFVPDPLFRCAGQRLYRTGDRGRWRADGTIEFLGRADRQVKVRGYRIELEEIERHLVACPSVAQAVVDVRDDVAGRQQLIGYVVLRDPMSGHGLSEFLKTTLPDYMVPSGFVVLEALPLTPNGKVDRQALSQAEMRQVNVMNGSTPQTATQRLLADVWRDVLGVPHVGLHDNFFALGGDSILSIQVISRLRQQGVRVSPRQLFQHQTIAELATVADAMPADGSGDQEPVEGEVPLSPIQHWFFEQDVPNPHHWNQSLLLDLKRPLDPAIIEQAVTSWVACHPALRLRFVNHEGEWRQWYGEHSDQSIFHLVDLSMLAQDQQATRVEEEVARWEASLDLTNGPVLRVVLFLHGGVQPDRLLFVVHHLVTDGISWRVLMEDFHVVYEQVASGKMVAMPASTASYASWSVRLHEFVERGSLEQEASYWLDPARRDVPPLPVDIPAGSRKEVDSEILHFWLAENETHSLIHDIHAAYRTRINDILVTALSLTLSRWSNQESVLIDLEGHWREDLFPDLDLSRTVGWFAGVYPVLLRASVSRPIEESLKSVKEQLRQIPRGGLGYGMLRYLPCRTTQDVRERLRASPPAKVRFNYLGQMDHVLPDHSPFVPSIDAAGVDRDPQSALPYDLDVNCDVLGGRLHVSWTASRCRYERATIEQLGQQFQQHLAALIRHCLECGAGGFTPSDFPLSGLDQPTIDRLLSGQHDVEDIYVLSPLQQGLLFHSLYTPQTGVYFEQLCCTLKGNVDVELFQQAMQDTLHRHPALRTSFMWEGLQDPIQIVHTQVSLSVACEDWRTHSEDTQQAQLADYLATDRQCGFDFSRAPLIRLALFRASDVSYRFVWTHHHILLDGWCVSLILEEFFSRYAALQQGERPVCAPGPAYCDYIAWQKAQDLAAAKRYWRSDLQGFLAPTPLGFVTGESIAQQEASADYGEQSLRLSEDLASSLSTLVNQAQITLNTVIQGAWTLLLSRYSGDDDVVFGITVSGRPPELPNVESMIGLFLNTLPLRVQLDPALSVLEWLQILFTKNIDIREYEYAPLSHIQRWSDVKNGQPLFESLLLFENYPMEHGFEGVQQTLTLSDVTINSQTHYPLTVDVNPGPPLQVTVSYARGRFSDRTITQILQHYRMLLETIVREPTQCLGDVCMLTKKEAQCLLTDWNATTRQWDERAQSVVELFEAQVAQTPEAVAVVCEHESVTYAELNARADRLAHQLQNLGVGPEVFVGLCLERSVEMVVGLLGIWKAGGAYVPLDPAYPQARLAFILEDAQPAVVLTQPSPGQVLPQADVQMVYLDQNGVRVTDGAGKHMSQPLGLERHAGYTAYVIYTSGSTGQPKGVMISHHNALNFLAAMQEQLQASETDCVLAVTSLSFDISLLELLLPLVVGARVSLADTATTHDGLRLRDRVEEGGITMMQATPATWRMLVDVGWQGGSGLHVLCGGEALTAELAADLLRRSDVVWNLYGPTETTVWSTMTRVTGNGEVISIGRSIANTQTYVLDASFQPVPIGVSGELYIGGEGLARGYWHRPELTAERFVPNPFSPKGGERLYRTGDSVLYRADGAIEFLGRLDHQVKLRGYRIELGEIEAQIRQQEGIHDAVVMAREGHTGGKELVGYIVPAVNGSFDLHAVKEALATRLPEYMVPKQWVELEQWPLTSNGKVDRHALPDPERTEQVIGEYVPPRTTTERSLVDIWAEVLGVEQVGIHDNFFELGGHSLLATRIMVQVRMVCGVELPLRWLFEAPTVAALAQAVETALYEQSKLERPPLISIPREGPMLLSFAQERLWVLAQLNPKSTAYNNLIALRLLGNLNAAALQWSLNEVLQRHEVLRTTFEMVGEEPVQTIRSHREFTLAVEDLSGIEDGQRENEIARLVMEEGKQAFDLSDYPLVRIKLFRMKDQQYVMCVTMHHIVSDGWSDAIWVREIQMLYEAACSGQQSPLPALPIQYADYAQWQRNWLQGQVLDDQVGYWRQQLRGAPEVLDLLSSNPRPSIQSFQGASYSFVIKSSVVEKLKKLSRKSGATLFMTLLAAFKILLARYSDREDIVVGTDVANRSHRELEGLIGFFVNLLALRTDLSGNPTFEELLARVREITLGAYAHQELPFEKIVEALRIPRTLAYNPVVQVLLVLQNTPEYSFTLPGLQLQEFTMDDKPSRFDMALFVSEQENELFMSWNYSTDLFDAQTIKRMGIQYSTLLESIVAQPTARLDALEMFQARGQAMSSIKQPPQRKTGFKKFKNRKPQVMQVTSQSLVSKVPLSPGSSLPLVIQPAVPDVDLVEWVQTHKDDIETDVQTQGAILFRGFSVNTVEQFECVAQAMCPDLFGQYGDLPREVKGENVYGSTPYPADHSILFHNESSHMSRWPLKQWFCCLVAPQEGGATPIVDCRNVYQNLSSELQKRFEEKHLMYVRHFLPGFDVRWQDFFQTTERTEVERYCHQHGLECTWLDEDALQTRQVCPAVTTHPKTGERVFFNQIQLHHVSCLDPNVRGSLQTMVGEDRLPRNVYYGDGSPLEDDVVQEICALYTHNAVRFPWQTGDLLMVDNMLVAHGRDPFVGSRKIVVAMGEMISHKNSKTVEV
ncbi:MAG: hypothetical protein NPIRA02_35350 [Nitrospirales bacterium]|nr:MAG: hypothetical protein NPIRA02_35350 [Nitrospirales bacterium]